MHEPQGILGVQESKQGHRGPLSGLQPISDTGIPVATAATLVRLLYSMSYLQILKVPELESLIGDGVLWTKINHQSILQQALVLGCAMLKSSGLGWAFVSSGFSNYGPSLISRQWLSTRFKYISGFRS